MYYDEGMEDQLTNKGLRVFTPNPMQHGTSGSPGNQDFDTQTSMVFRNIAVGLTSLGTVRNAVAGPSFNLETHNL